MRNAFQDRACVEYLLQVILEKKDLKVESHTIQADYKNLYGHSAFLDCVACDAQNRRYNVEIQQEAENRMQAFCADPLYGQQDNEGRHPQGDQQLPQLIQPVIDQGDAHAQEEDGEIGQKAQGDHDGKACLNAAV